MKKLLTAAFSAALLFMAGCADSDTGAVKDTTESFLKAEHEGNLDEATKYLTGDATDMFESREDMRADLKGYEDQGVSNETLDQFVDAQIKAYTMVWEDSKIDDVQVGDDTATVLVTTKGIGMKDWENMTTSGLSAEVGSQWMDDNMSRIEEYKSSHTEEEYMAWYLDGGVIANGYLRATLEEECKKAGLKLVLPEKKYCTDNAAMIAAEGLIQYKAGNFAPLSINARAQIPLK